MATQNSDNNIEIPDTLIDVKGDLIVGSADDTPARLGVGADGLVLTAHSSSAEGLMWAGIPIPITTPIGAVVLWPTATAPINWIICDGAAISEATYAALFAVIGHTYNGDPGGGNFNLPNMKSRVPIGLDEADASNDVLGETGGQKAMPAHVHRTTTYGASGAHTHHGSPLHFATAPTNFSAPDYQNTEAAGSGGSSADNRPPFITLNYIIRYA